MPPWACRREAVAGGRFAALAALACLFLAGTGAWAPSRAQSVVSADTISTDDTRNFLDYDLRGMDAWYIRGFDSFLFADDPAVGDAARGAPVRVDETFRFTDVEEFAAVVRELGRALA